MNARTFVKGIWKSIVASCLFVIPGAISFNDLGWTSQSDSTQQQSIYIESKQNTPSTPNDMYKVGQKIAKQISEISSDILLYCTSEEASIEVIYPDGTNVEQLMSELREALSGVKIPDYARFPTVSRGNKKWLMQISIASNNPALSNAELTETAKKFIAKRIESVPGVTKVEVYGEPKSEIVLDLKPAQVIAYGIDVEDLKTVFKSYSTEKAFLEKDTAIKKYSSYAQSFLANAATKQDIVNYIENIVIDKSKSYDQENQKIIKIKDIANVSVKGRENIRENLLNGKRGVNIKIFKSFRANPVEVSDAIRKAIKDVLEDPNYSVYIQDTAQKIRNVVNKTFRSFIEAIILVLLVIFLFLGSLKASITPILAIPISIIGAFWPMKLFGCSINISTLSAIILSIGLVVDDAIVMIEGITKEYTGDKEHNWEKASIKAVENLTVPIIVMTSTLMFIFMPIIFTKGVLGKVLKEFAITLSSAVLLSGVVSLTLSPAISARFMEHSEWADRMFHPIEVFYRKALAFLSRFKSTLLFFVAISLGTSFIMFTRIPKETFPMSTQKTLSLSSVNNSNTNIKYFRKQAEKITKILKEYKEIEVFKIFLDSSISITVEFKQDVKNVDKIKDEIVKKIDYQIPEINFILDDDDDSEEGAFQIYIYGNKDIEEIDEASDLFISALEKIPGIVDYVRTLTKKDTYDIVLDLDKASQVGVKTEHLTRMLEFLNARWRIAKTKVGADFIKIVSTSDPKVEFQKKADFRTMSEREKININPGSFLFYEKKQQMTSRIGFRSMPAVKYRILFDQSFPIGKILEQVEMLKKKYLGSQYDIFYTGKARQFLLEKNEMTNTLILSVIFITLILLAQFESLRNTIIVMFTAPLSFVGAVLMLWFTKSTINVYTITGLITLIALIVKHGILFVSGTEEFVKKGLNTKEAIVESAVTRLKPVLMTTICMCIGVLPLVFSKAPEMLSIQQISLVISGGILIGTGMTLFVLPFVMDLLSVEKNTTKENTYKEEYDE